MMRGLWRSFVPFLLWWPDVSRVTMRADAFAALTGVIVVLPQGVAFATIAGMPPEYGLYAAMVPAVVAALFGSSRQLVSGPTTAASIVLFSTLSALAAPGSAAYVQYALTLTFMVGAIQLVMGLARLGTLVNFVSHSVIVGFTSGAAVLIAASQLKNFLGLDMPGGLRFHEIVVHVWNLAGEIDPDSVVVGVVTLAVGVAFKRYWPRFPYMVAALVAGSLLAGLIEFFTYAGFLHPANGQSGLRLVGAVPATLPPLSIPDFSFATITQLGPAALAVTLFALTEAVSISRSLSARTGELVDGNQEFVGQGLSNIVGSFFSAYVATGSFNRSAVNAEARRPDAGRRAPRRGAPDGTGAGGRPAAGAPADAGDGRAPVSGRVGHRGRAPYPDHRAGERRRRGGAVDHVRRHAAVPARLRDHPRRVPVADHLSPAGVAPVGAGAGAGPARAPAPVRHRRDASSMPAARARAHRRRAVLRRGELRRGAPAAHRRT